MGKKFDFEYIIIGSGPAGSAAAMALAKAKKRVALVEGRLFGGAHLNTRDVPYASALNFSHHYHKTLSFPELSASEFSFNFPTIINRELKTILAAGGNDKKPFEEAGIICIKGYANFLDAHTIAVGENKFTSENFVLATGSRLDTSTISGTELVNYLTPETAIRVRRLPKAVLVIGGGATGCEIASYYAELGAKVIIMESENRLLPREDKEVGKAIADYFTNELGVLVLPNSKVVALEPEDSLKRVIFRNDRREKMVRVDCVVLATGSRPTLDYGLENAGVKYNEKGIIVNKFLETSAKNIFAIGDCIGGESSTDRATFEGVILAANLLGKTKALLDYSGFARVVNTFPAVATVGKTELDLAAKKRKFKKIVVPLSDSLVSKIDGSTYGFVKLLADSSNHLLGATIVAPNAEYLISELALVIRHHLTLLELASTPHLSSTYSSLIKLAAKKLLDKKSA